MKDHFIKIALISTIGVCLSVILVIHHVDAFYDFTPNAPSSCAISEGFDCDKVAQSEYSTLFNLIPLASIGLFFYLLLVITSLTGLFVEEEEKKILFKNTLFFLSTIGLCSSIYYSVISFFVIKSICLYCASLYAVSLIIWVITFLNKQSFINDFTSGFKALVINYFKPSLGVGPLYSVAILLAFSTSVFMEGFIAWNVFTDKVTRHKVGDIVQTQNAKIIPDMDAAQKGLEQWRSAPVVEGLLRENDPVLGDRGGEAVIVKFSDFQCPACKKMHFVIEELVGDFGEGVLFVDKQFPLSSDCNPLMTSKGHSYACLMSKAALCAKDQDAYWSAANYLYTIPLLTEGSINNTAAKIGINESAFKACMSQENFQPKISQDTQLGKELKVRSTPTIYINGKQLKEGLPGSLVLVLREILKK